VVDWDAGNYERTAAELEPVARAVVERAAPAPGEHLLDLACGTGNAALLAAASGARVLGVDGAGRLLDVARQRARSLGLEIEFRQGDLLELPVEDDAADVVVSVFGLVYASEPSEAIHELARVIRPGGRAYVTAWIPAGPIDAMLTAMGRVLGRVTQAPAPKRFPWSHQDAVNDLAGQAGLSLQDTWAGELAISDSSPEAYVAGGREHPVALAVRPVLQKADAGSEVEAAMLSALREGNEDPDGFLVHSPYVVHELRAVSPRLSADRQ
jgi:SAM-dependent methyltransferase